VTELESAWLKELESVLYSGQVKEIELALMWAEDGIRRSERCMC